MRNLTLSTFILMFAASAFGYEGPSPLQKVEIHAVVGVDSQGAYHYSYTLTNPSSYDGEIESFDIFLPRDPATDADLPAGGFTYCKIYHRNISEKILQNKNTIPVGAAGPKKWSCGYGTLAGYKVPSFGWGAIDGPYVIKPGSSQTFGLTSFGPPGIQDAMVRPDIDYERLPDTYRENLPKTVALVNKVKWIGKVVAPRTLPKVFDPRAYMTYLIALVDQSRTQGWIDNDGIVNSLLAKLNTAQSKVGVDKATAKKTLNAFMNEVSAQNGKHLTSEAYALLYFNAKYLADHL